MDRYLNYSVSFFEFLFKLRVWDLEFEPWRKYHKRSLLHRNQTLGLKVYLLFSKKRIMYSIAYYANSCKRMSRFGIPHGYTPRVFTFSLFAFTRRFPREYSNTLHKLSRTRFGHIFRDTFLKGRTFHTAVHFSTSRLKDVR